MHENTRDIAAKVLEVVDAGLVKGVGNPKPGHMCVEAAVCFALESAVSSIDEAMSSIDEATA